MNEHLLLSAVAGFESAVRLDHLPEGYRAHQLHGHSYQLRARIAPPAGWEQFPGAGVDQLRNALQAAVAPLDYAYLNDVLSQPTDDRLARWLHQRLALAGLQQLGVKSTAHSGVDLDDHGNSTVWRRYRFEAAHRLPHVPMGHKCGRMHGHGFEVILHAHLGFGEQALTSELDALDAVWLPIHQQLHLACLNEIDGLHNPTSELIASWIWHRIKSMLPQLRWVTVFETASSGAHFDGSHYRIWKAFTLDSAVQLVHAPGADLRRRVHGHTYTLRLHLHAPLDQVMGWTVDYGDVKACFDPIFNKIDHHPIHELPGLAHADSAAFARWIRRQVQPLLPQLDRIDLEETPGCGVVLAWGDHEPALSI
ncbi:MAG: 6-pyruvoyl tetrahydropterin synthase [Burkholderiaceae bacterium]|nr:6-pyruvoyl tetrahydropterin synthase [Burkholderiaceae bacterium]